MLEISSQLILEGVVDKESHHQVEKDLPSTHVIQLAMVELYFQILAQHFLHVPYVLVILLLKC
jgi:hypothetical protein